MRNTRTVSSPSEIESSLGVTTSVALLDPAMIVIVSGNSAKSSPELAVPDCARLIIRFELVPPVLENKKAAESVPGSDADESTATIETVTGFFTRIEVAPSAVFPVGLNAVSCSTVSA